MTVAIRRSSALRSIKIAATSATERCTSRASASIKQGKLVATNVQGVMVKNAGHWLMEEAPGQVIPALVDFLDR